MAKRKQIGSQESERASKRQRIDESPVEDVLEQEQLEPERQPDEIEEQWRLRRKKWYDALPDFKERDDEWWDEYGFPPACTVTSYGEEDQEELKEAALWEMEYLLNLAGILRDSMDMKPEPKPTKGAPKGKGKGKANKPKPAGPDWLHGWEFYREGHVRRGMTKYIQPQLDYITKMKEAWRPPPGRKLEMPEHWFQAETTIILANNRPWDMEKYDREKVAKTRISFYTEPIGEHLERVPTNDIIRRHLSTRLSQAIKPDWCLHTRQIRPDERPGNTKPEDYKSNIEIYPALDKWLDVMNLPMGEHNCEITFLSFFTNLPALWMLMTPEQNWLEGLRYDMPDQKIEFALVKESVRPFTKEEVEILRDIPISYSHPAVFVAMKGPAQWPDFVRKWDQPHHFASEQWASMSQEERLGFCVENLACAVQPSLDAFVVNWFLRCEQQETRKRRTNYEKLYPIYPPPDEGENVDEFLPDSEDEEPNPEYLEYADLPEWAWIPGILYDYDNCYLMAHIPVIPEDLEGPIPVSYVSYLIDTIPMARPPSGDDDDRLCLVERARMGLAWSCLAKHAFKVTSMWDSVVQPPHVMHYEEVRDYKEGKDSTAGRPPSEDRRPVRAIDLSGWNQAYGRSNNTTAQNARNRNNISMDAVFELPENEEEEMLKRNEMARPVLKERITPRIERWLATLEDDTAEFHLLGVNQDEEIPVGYRSEVNYPEEDGQVTPDDPPPAQSPIYYSSDSD